MVTLWKAAEENVTDCGKIQLKILMLTPVPVVAKPTSVNHVWELQPKFCAIDGNIAATENKMQKVKAHRRHRMKAAKLFLLLCERREEQ